MGSRTFPPDHLSKVRSGMWGNNLLISFLISPKHCTNAPRGLSLWGCSSWEWQDSPLSPYVGTAPTTSTSSPLSIGFDEIPKLWKKVLDLRTTLTEYNPPPPELKILYNLFCSFPNSWGTLLQCLLEKDKYRPNVSHIKMRFHKKQNLSNAKLRSWTNLEYPMTSKLLEP